MSSTSLAENAKACTEQFDQMLELFPDKDETLSHPLYQKVLDYFAKALAGTDKDSIQGLSRKMIDHEYERFNSWIDIGQHIMENQSDLSASHSTRDFVQLLLEALISVKEQLTEIRQTLSGERANKVYIGRLLTPLYLYYTTGVSPSRARRFWRPITSTDLLYASCDDEIDFLFDVTGDIDGCLHRKQEKEARVEEMKKFLGPTLWKEKLAIEEERKKRLGLPVREDVEAEDLG